MGKQLVSGCPSARCGAFAYGKITLSYCLPDTGKVASACYLHGTGDSSQNMELLHRVYGLLAGREIAVFMIEGEDWNADLSPWEAPPVFKAAPPFAGKASGYLSFLCGQVIPQTEERLSISVQKRSLSGYSLAGLFSVYAMYQSALFTEVASVSGSLWFDGFLDYMKENVPLKKPEKVYFSLGAKEKETKNPRMAKVESCTLAAKEYLEGLGIPCLFESNAGGHFHQAQERMEKAIQSLYHEVTIRG